MKFMKPWQPKEKKVDLNSLSEEEREIEETKRMLKKYDKVIGLNLRVARSNPNVFAMVQSQIWGMIEKQIKDDAEKVKAKGETLTVEKFMAKLDKIDGVYDFYRKVDITKEDIRIKAEELLK